MESSEIDLAVSLCAKLQLTLPADDKLNFREK